MNNRLHAIVARKQSVEPVIGREVIGEAVGAIAEQVFESSRVGDLGYNLAKKWAAWKHADQVNAERASVDYDVRQITGQALELLSQVSVDDPSLRPPGNSDRLVRRLRRIAGFANTETKILRALEDPRGTVYLVLVQAHRPLSRQSLQELTRLHIRTVDRALRFLYQKDLVDKIMGR